MPEAYSTVTLLEMQSGMLVRFRLLQLYSSPPSGRLAYGHTHAVSLDHFAIALVSVMESSITIKHEVSIVVERYR